MDLLWDFVESQSESDYTPVICLLLSPELPNRVNKMYRALEAIWHQSRDWLKACNVKKVGYHGRSFIGNDSKKLLQNVDGLKELNLPSSCGRFVSAFKFFSEVVPLCYGTELHQ